MDGESIASRRFSRTGEIKTSVVVSSPSGIEERELSRTEIHNIITIHDA
jgi:hypothetical protein